MLVPLLISFSYFFTRLANLTILPVFNDEAIYIDWGQKMLATGNFFMFLYDGKQPLLMWFFGLFANLFPDPLFGARLVSVLVGFFSLLAIYKLSQKYFSQSVAIIASVLYILSPIFLFYDRQALMESTITCLGLWSLYILLNHLTIPLFKSAIYLGLLWGIGMSVKTSFGVYILVSLLIMSWRLKNQLPDLVKWCFVIFPIMLVICSPLIFQSGFSNIIELNSRFVFTLPELFHFPISAWFHNFLAVISTTFWQNLILLTLLIPLAIITLFSKVKVFAFWYLACLLIFILTTRSPSPRYFVSFLPLGLIFASDFLLRLPKKVSLFLFLTTISWLVYLDKQLIFNPLEYFRSLNHLTAYSQSEIYTGSFTSGYGVKPAIDYVLKLTGKKPAIVSTRPDAGNPESSVFFYLSKYDQIEVTYLDNRVVTLPVNQDFIPSKIPIYFITRNNQLAGLDKYLIKKAEFPKPDQTSSITVYQIRTSN